MILHKNAINWRDQIHKYEMTVNESFVFFYFTCEKKEYSYLISNSFSQQKKKNLFAYFDAYQISALSTLSAHISQWS